jgi:hypothetical protein
MKADMANSEPVKQNVPAGGGKPAAKKQYTKPEVRHEVVFETMALSCGKIQSTQGPCHSNRKSS